MYLVPLATLGELAALEAGAESVGAFGVGECGRCVRRGEIECVMQWFLESKSKQKRTACETGPAAVSKRKGPRSRSLCVFLSLILAN
jgi:hypothetical protein